MGEAVSEHVFAFEESKMTDKSQGTVSTAQALRDSIQMTDALIEKASKDKSEKYVVKALLAQRLELARALKNLADGQMIALISKSERNR